MLFLSVNSRGSLDRLRRSAAARVSSSTRQPSPSRRAAFRAFWVAPPTKLRALYLALCPSSQAPRVPLRRHSRGSSEVSPAKFPIRVLRGAASSFVCNKIRTFGQSPFDVYSLFSVTCERFAKKHRTLMPLASPAIPEGNVGTELVFNTKCDSSVPLWGYLDRENPKMNCLRLDSTPKVAIL